MKKPFKKTKVGQFLTKSLTGKVIVGLADGATMGLASNIIEETETSPAGKVDPYKAIGTTVVVLVLIVLVAKGIITVEQAEDLNGLLDN